MEVTVPYFRDSYCRHWTGRPCRISEGGLQLEITKSKACALLWIIFPQGKNKNMHFL